MYRRRQGGVALVTALMIVALATVISANISTLLQIDIRRTGNIINSDQAKLYTYSAETLAIRYLDEDYSQNKTDHLLEPWAQEYIFPLEGGTLKASLKDMHSCININSIVVGGQPHKVTEDRIKLLLQNLGLEPTLTQAIIDWIDDDLTTTIPDGAEDGHYTSLPTPYRTANGPLHSISELRMIKGFEEDGIYRKATEYLCAFIDGSTATDINVNTASAEVLSSLSSNLDRTTVESIMQYRESTPFNDMNEFKNFGNLATTITVTDHLTVSSSFFLLETLVSIDSNQALMYSVLHRDNAGNGKTRVVARSQSVY